MVTAEFGPMTNGLRDALQLERPHPRYDTSGGTGVIYVGGGKYWPGIYVGIRMLRQLGCELPVEVWYRGRCEEVYSEDVEGMGVTFHDVDALGQQTGLSSIPTGNPGSGGWEAKLTAMMLTRFSRVLYLDADAYVVEEPSKLFAAAGDSLLSFWKDLHGQDRTVKWDRVLPGGCATGVPQIQGGQLVIDRIKGWRMIHVADYLCQHSHYYFRHMYGDQDAWRVALAALKQTGRDYSYANLGKAEWSDVAFLCKIGGQTQVVHRCQGKMFEPRHIPPGRVKYSNPQYHLPREVLAFDFFAKVLNRRRRESTHVFHEIYSRRLWGPQPSGAGTRLKESQLYIDTVNHFARENGWKSAVDLGCGDGLVSTRLQFERYTGLDCIPSVVDTYCRKLAGFHDVGGVIVSRQYGILDFFKDREQIPPADVLLIKDVFHHWPVHMIQEFLDYLIQSKRWRAAVLCQDDRQIHDQQDCPLGGYRALSPTMHPLLRYPLVSLTKVHHKTLAVLDLKRE